MTDTEHITPDHDLMMQDMRDGWRSARRILTRFALAAIGFGIFMYLTELIEGTR